MRPHHGGRTRSAGRRGTGAGAGVDAGAVVIFAVLGGLGVVLLAGSLLFGDVLDGLLGSVDLGGGIASTEVIGAFLAAFGITAALLSAGSAAPVAVVVGGGLAAGVVTGALTFGVVQMLTRMPTDATPSPQDLDGRLARVITRIPPEGLGEVTVTVGGHRMKLSARADRPIPEGSDVVIVSAISATSVLVTEVEI